MSTTQVDALVESWDWQKRCRIRFLSDLKFAGVKPVASDDNVDEKGEKAGPMTYTTQDPAQSQGETEALQGGQACAHQYRYDKLAADKPGEELAPDSSIWRLYTREAKEHDRELVERRNKNLDTMLLFAGLFSAILTAFLVESTNLLEPNLVETSVALLLDIAQSQRRAGNGNQTDSLPPIDLPDFRPSVFARWINALWFIALALSLGAAMMAMLAKEWLEEFVAHTPTDPHEYARERQSRLDALMSWETLRIIDFLPTLLHFSLVLFAIGLIMHLWRLDGVVALILAVASVGLFILYATVVFLGAVREQCPYRTRVSKYLRKILDKCRSGNSPALLKGRLRSSKPGNKSGRKRPEFKGTTLADLRALDWLTSKARDPAVGDSAFQALAGLKTRELEQMRDVQPQETLGPEPLREGTERRHERVWTNIRAWFPGCARNSGCNGSQNFNETSTEVSSVLDGYYTVMRMGSEIIDSLQTARETSSRELAFCRGTNVARYASALPEIYYHANESLKQFQEKIKRGHKRYQDWAGHQERVNIFKRSAFKALDMIWSDECPPFTTDAYAELTAAELRLTGLAVAEVKVNQAPAGPSEDPEKGATSFHASVDMHTLSSPELNLGERITRHRPTLGSLLCLLGLKSNPEKSPDTFIPGEISVKLSDLQARCSRALCRAAFQLAFHSNGRAPIGNFSLINLLESISALGEDHRLSSSGHIITHYPQYDDYAPTTIYVLISGDIGYRNLPPDAIGDEDALLAGLTNILGSKSLKTVPKVETAAMRATASIVPRLIKQWIAIQPGLEYPNPMASTDAIGIEPDSKWDWFDGSWEKFDHDGANRLPPEERARIVINYLINIATFAMAFFDREEICELPGIAIKALFMGVYARSSPEIRDVAHQMIANRHVLLGKWLKSVGRPATQVACRRAWKRESNTYLLRLLAIQSQLRVEPVTILSQLLLNNEANTGEDAQEIFLIILEIMTDVPGHQGDMERLLRTVLTCVCTQTVDGPYTRCFTDISNGFDCLIKIGSHPRHTHCTSETIAKLIVHFVRRDGGWTKSNTTIVFLKAVLFVCEHPPSRWDTILEELLPLLAQALESLIKSGLFESEGLLLTSLSRRVLKALVIESERTNDYKSQESFQRCCDMVEKKTKKTQKVIEALQRWAELPKARSAQLSAQREQGDIPSEEESTDT